MLLVPPNLISQAIQTTFSSLFISFSSTWDPILISLDLHLLSLDSVLTFLDLNLLSLDTIFLSIELISFLKTSVFYLLSPFLSL